MKKEVKLNLADSFHTLRDFIKSRILFCEKYSIQEHPHTKNFKNNNIFDLVYKCLDKCVRIFNATDKLCLFNIFASIFLFEEQRQWGERVDRFLKKSLLICYKLLKINNFYDDC